MASHTAIHPPRMTIAHGIGGFAVAAVAEVTGTSASPDHAIAIALISVIGGFGVMLAQLTVSDALRRRRERAAIADRHPDHDMEQHEVNDLLLDRMLAMQREMDELRERNKRRP